MAENTENGAQADGPGGGDSAFAAVLWRCGTFMGRRVVVDISDGASLVSVAWMEGRLQRPNFIEAAGDDEVVDFPVGGSGIGVVLDRAALVHAETGTDWISFTMGECIVSITAEPEVEMTP